MNKSYNKKRGSILLEALLSILILSTSISLIIQAMTASLRATQYSADYLDALFLLENKLFDAFSKTVLSNDDLFSDEEQGVYIYSVVDEEFIDSIVPDEEEQNLIHSLSAEVSWRRGKRNNAVAIETFLLETEE